MVIARLSSATTFSSLYQTGHGICLQGDGCVPETGNHSGKPAHFAPSHLDRDFEAHKPNERWVNDVTYIRTHERFLYQAIVLDLVFSADYWLVHENENVGRLGDSRVADSFVAAQAKTGNSDSGRLRLAIYQPRMERLPEGSPREAQHEPSRKLSRHCGWRELLLAA
jgi:hypothetical protein